jgi:hypothetical protein
MSGRSTAKRSLEVDEDEDSRRENHRLNLKRYQHDVYPRSASASPSSSRSSYGRTSSLKTLSDEVRKMFVGLEEGAVELPSKNCNLRIPYSWLLANVRRPPTLVRSARNLWLSISSCIVFLLDYWPPISGTRPSEGRENMFWNGASLKFLRRFTTIFSDGSLT